MEETRYASFSDLIEKIYQELIGNLFYSQIKLCQMTINQEVHKIDNFEKNSLKIKEIVKEIFHEIFPNIITIYNKQFLFFE